MRKRRRLLKFALGGLAALFLLGVASIIGVYFWIAPSLPSVEMLRDVHLQEPMRVYTRDGELMAEFGEQKRLPLSWEEMPEQVWQAFLAAEDDRFFEHPGVDWQGLLRAGVNHLLTGDRSQGGGTITMLVAREFFLTREKTYIRKLREIFLAFRIENELTKEEILTLFLNKIYLGNRAYGIGAAAQIYFGVDARDLTIAQAAALAATAQRPSENNPASGTSRFAARRAYVLGRMHTLGIITDEQRQEALATSAVTEIHGPSVEVDAPYVAEMVRAEILQRFGPDAYTRGLRVTTSIDAEAQTAAVQALRMALHQYDFRQGYRGPVRRVELDGESGPPAIEVLDDILDEVRVPALLTAGIVLATTERGATVYLGGGVHQELDWRALSWARAAREDENSPLGPIPQTAADVVTPGDVVLLLDLGGESGWRLAQIPEAQGAIASLDAADGGILAVVGGYDFGLSQYNRAVQAARQPGSSFKPFLYSAALARGFTPATVVNDAPVVFEEDEALERDWRPQNDSGRFYGPTRLREAITYSRNLVSIRVLRAIGVGYAVDYVQRFGFERSRLPRDLSLSLGSTVLSPLEMARGYSVLANGGFAVQPWLIRRIEDANGSILLEHDPVVACADCEEWQAPIIDPAADELPEFRPPLRLAERVVDAGTAFLIDDMLRDVVRRGTGRAALVLNRGDLAGKTGSTNDFADAWFAGYGGGVVAVAWVGHDQVRSLGAQEYGGRAALPIWIDYMRVATRDRPEAFRLQPPGIVTARISPETGRLAGVDDVDAIFEYFREEDLIRLEEEARAALERPDEERSDEVILF